MAPAPIFYGACGNERCLYCLPIFDADNNLIPGTDTDRLSWVDLREIVDAHLARKGRDS